MSVRRGIGVCLFVMTLAVSGGQVYAAADEAVGQVVFVSGDASVQRNGQSATPLNFGDDIYPQDILETGEGTLRVLFTDDTVLTLVAHSKVMVTEYIYQPGQGQRRSIFDVISGGLHAIVERAGNLISSNVRFQTPTAVAGIRGTTLGVYYHPGTGSTHFLAFDGQLETYHRDYPEQRVIVNKGFLTQIVDGPPSEPVPISDEWNDFFSMGHISLHDMTQQRGGSGLDSLGDVRLTDVGGGGTTDTADAAALQPPGFTGLPGALQEFPLPTAPVGGVPGGGGTGGGGPGGGGPGAPAPVNGPVSVQPTFPDPG